jgi:hypothetical protein
MAPTGHISADQKSCYKPNVNGMGSLRSCLSGCDRFFPNYLKQLLIYGWRRQEILVAGKMFDYIQKNFWLTREWNCKTTSSDKRKKQLSNTKNKWRPTIPARIDGPPFDPALGYEQRPKGRKLSKDHQIRAFCQRKANIDTAIASSAKLNHQEYKTSVLNTSISSATIFEVCCVTIVRASFAGSYAMSPELPVMATFRKESSHTSHLWPDRQSGPRFYFRRSSGIQSVLPFPRF